MTYQEFLKSKVQFDHGCGFNCSAEDVNPLLKPHHRDIVIWAVRGGRRAVFTAFGLGKSVIQLEIVRIVLEKCGGGAGLITMPLNVTQEFKTDCHMLATGEHPKVEFPKEKLAELKAWQEGRPDRIPSIRFISKSDDMDGDGIYMTNYEKVRERLVDPRLFAVNSLDEASALRGMGSTKTFREFMALFENSGLFRFVATATPSPNDFIELLAYSAVLDIMDVGQAKTRFFKRNSEKADKLTIHPHKEKEFWLWVASWAIFVQKPSDLGYSDEGYILPELDIRWHEIPTDNSNAGQERNGQQRLLRNASAGVVDAAREKARSINDRVAKMMELREEDPSAHRIIWHDLEAERHAIEKAIPGIASIFGNQDYQVREQKIVDFSNGKLPELAAKPCIAGSGCNFQRHCHWAIFLGIGFKFNDFIQAIHRLQRFLQTDQVRVDLIYTEAERGVKDDLIRKWNQHVEMVAIMTGIIKEFGLSHVAMAQELTRSIGVERQVVEGKMFRAINNDTVEEMPNIESNTLGLILTSIPFGNQYEYSPNYSDFGHTDGPEHFFAQMDYLTPELFRVLMPGRIAAIHVKDRIVPGGLTGLGFQTVYPFHADCIRHYEKHGFAYMGMKTIVTDVVRENNQTYRLGWTEQCKDGTKMGCGMPEYLLLFRKPPSDTSNSYADIPVVKSKERYSRSRWQVDAHGYMRSSGNRLLQASDLAGIPHDMIFKLFRQHSFENVYDFEHHVTLAEALEARGELPVTFMLLQPQSWQEDVWTDVTRMLTLNGAQHAKGKEMHLCPMQFDIADRVIEQMSMPGEIVFDPFAGLGTVPMRAIKAGRFGLGCELSPAYWLDSLSYLRAAELESSMPTLFELDEHIEVEAA